MSASTLGINNLIVVAPMLDTFLIETAKKVNPRVNLTCIEGFYTHPIMNGLFNDCNLIVDLSSYGLANKLSLEKGFRENIPIIRGFSYENADEQGFKVFTYTKGREWDQLNSVISPHSMPKNHFDDGVLNIMTAGLVLEETKNLLMDRQVSEAIISYMRKRLTAIESDQGILVVGAGALGIFVGLGLAYSQFQHLTFMDPDVVDVTNLNRQVLFHDAIGKSKAETLSQRLNRFPGITANAVVDYFDNDTDISPYSVVFDCVDNFETRIALSEKCMAEEKVLISGGTNPEAGQAVLFDPEKNGETPAELLGLYEIVESREIDTKRSERTACTYHPDPSVIMANQIIAGAMVDAYRILLGGNDPDNIFYDSTSDTRI
ncbi:MAG: ThiF family adenylyltransferase [Deltaproteobacteria bacterium]|nr:ThiF family adenylyltransferase [Deltaproteobacteria bacterium]